MSDKHSPIERITAIFNAYGYPESGTTQKWIWAILNYLEEEYESRTKS